MSEQSIADPFHLSRFVQAQESTWPQARAELAQGRKTSHWMWFVFPQVAGLGRSEMSRRFAISSLDEARAYLAHPVLGPRLLDAAELAATAPAASVEELLGEVDAAKLHSSMTLFKLAEPGETTFSKVLARWFGGELDHATTQLVAG